MPFNFVDVITITIASIGAILGVINTWKAYKRDKVKLKVIPGYSIPAGNFDEQNVRFFIKVVNLSIFPVVISEVGFFMPYPKKRILFITQVCLNGNSLPIRLEPRTSFSAYFRSDVVDDSIKNNKASNVYALTECGHLEKGSSSTFKKIVCG